MLHRKHTLFSDPGGIKVKLPITGQCLCGNVKYSFTQEPKEKGLCYCRSCQRKSGSSHIAYLADKESHVKIMGTVKWYGAVGESGHPKQHGFCSECGSVSGKTGIRSQNCTPSHKLINTLLFGLVLPRNVL